MLSDRFWSKVDKSGDCWVWTSSLDQHGYGTFYLDRASRMAHRLSYEDAVGPIPKGLVLDHLCRNRACVNPTHLEVVTHRTNILRGVGTSAVNARKALCAKGHPLDVHRSNPDWRQCKTCDREYERERYRRNHNVPESSYRPDRIAKASKL